MKVIVFGGGGEMGGEAVKGLAKAFDVEQVIATDINEKAAEKSAAEAGGGNVAGVFCDANDYETVVKLMKQADVCLNCIGPFYEYEEKMLRAAIEAKRDYVSICDDFDAVETALKLDKNAKKAGITALTGMGWTPGLSNVLAKKCMESLERSSTINISWAGCADYSEGIAIIKHALHIFTGDVPTYSGGRWKRVPAGSGRQTVEFPEPIGRISVYHLGHPEPLTIPHFISGLDTVTLKGGVVPEWINFMAITMNKLGLTNTPKKRNVGASLFHLMSTSASKSQQPVSGIHVRVIGEKNGSPAEAVASCADKMKRLTGIPAAVGTLMVGRKQISDKGVLAPEICVPTDTFLKEIKKRDMAVHIKVSS